MGILLQDDPDPDAMASGLALRALLGRTRATAPLLSFGRVTRPENLAMVEALEIEVDQVTPEGLRAYDALAMVDVQPTFCEEALPADRGRHRPSSGGEGLARAVPGRAAHVRRDVDDHDRVPARGRREDHGAGRDRALLRHQDRHAPPRAQRHAGGHGRPSRISTGWPITTSCAGSSARSCRSTPSTRWATRWSTARSSRTPSSPTWAGSAGPISSRSSRTCASRSRASSGRSSPA